MGDKDEKELLKKQLEDKIKEHQALIEKHNEAKMRVPYLVGQIKLGITELKKETVIGDARFNVHAKLDKHLEELNEFLFQ